MKNPMIKKMKLPIILLSVSVLITILGIALAEQTHDVIMIIGIIADIVCAVWLWWLKDDSRKYCDQCASSLMGCAWEYDTVSAVQKFNNQRNEYYDEYVFLIRAKCPSCGAVKEFKKKFTLKDGENPRVKIEAFMRSHYGDRL